ncbi:hypothetical protein [Roseomonas sp. CECT 9278]|uniref:hypothetical protein n=1 Tax=Roseomonas sp. CECT 9278 TaxID=2845823 RepID=UPI001E2F4D73|nr:hypothetical protein [Roseomonas sp. CECT 9278]CAH0266561.1 hypothetical protein ROS9278_03540 [Roseomonas sp. CECT 9278]
MDILLTRHGQRRMQQRAIPALVVSLIHSEGSVSQSHDGCEVRYVDKAARRRIRDALGGDRAYSMFERWFGRTYVVVSEDGAVVTAGHRKHRISRL